MRRYGLTIDENRLPSHIAIIMDGNGRWAEKRGLPRISGHSQGYITLKKIIEYNRKIGVPYISVYAFSTENWNRPGDEISFLMELAEKLVIEYTPTLIKNDIRLLITGTRDNIEGKLNASLDESINATKGCGSYTLNIVFNYGGRKEISDAAARIASDCLKGNIALSDIDQTKFNEYLYHPELPDVDLLIRTSGEKRVSNFLLWQVSYAEFWFTKRLWPDFNAVDFCRAIVDFQNRKRRYGKV